MASFVSFGCDEVSPFSSAVDNTNIGQATSLLSISLSGSFYSSPWLQV